MPFISGFDDFAKLQNCEVLKIKDSDFETAWLFANGATAVLHKLTRVFEAYDPPREPFALLRAKRQYLATKLGREAKDYEAALADYKERSSNAVRYAHHCPPVPAGALAALQAGWDDIEKLRQELATIDAELSQSPEGILARQRRELDERDSANLAARQRTANLFASMSPNGPPPAPSQDITEVVGAYLNKQA